VGEGECLEQAGKAAFRWRTLAGLSVAHEDAVRVLVMSVQPDPAEQLKNIQGVGGDYRVMLATWIASADLEYAESLINDRRG